MPWNMSDYPASMKNMDPLVRKKAIDIANALAAKGYEDSRAIPIAQEQAQDWHDSASEQEKQDFEQEPNPTKNDEHETTSHTDLIDNDVKVFYDDNVWKVKTVGAKKAVENFDYKNDAVKRAKEMINHKESKLIVYKQDGEIQSTHKP